MKPDYTIIDISIPLTTGMLVYPNDPEVKIDTLARMPEDGKMLSGASFGMHSGTHVDAPAHALLGGKLLEDMPLSALVGPCRVLDFSGVKDVVRVEDLKSKNIQKGERILIKTENSEKGFEEFRSDYVYLDGDAAEYLAETGVACFGIDYLSIKQRGSKDNRPHTALLEKNIPILETLNLKGVEEGNYFLIALPLKFIGVEASPVRAVLLS